MKKILLALALGSILLPKAYASEKNTEIKEEMTMTDSYIVENINEEGVDIFKKSNENDKYNIKKSDLKGLDIKKGDELIVDSSNEVLNSYPAHFTKVNSVKKAEEKKEDNNESKLKDIFIVEDISKEGVTLLRKSKPEDKFIVGSDKIKDLDLSKGDELEIESDDIILPSNPAQFGKIYGIKKVASKDNKKANKEAEKLPSPDKKVDKKEEKNQAKEASKENKNEKVEAKSKEKTKASTNPKTGILGSMPIVLTGLASVLALKKTKK